MVDRSDRFAGRIAVITGGGNGLGRASALKLAAEGASVVIADLLVEPGKATVDDITQAGGTAVFVENEAADPDSNRAVMDLAVDRFGGVDVVVTAAGVSSGDYESGNLERSRKRLSQAAEAAADNPIAALTELDVDDWRRVLDVNLTGTLLAVQAGARAMYEGGRSGAIVTIASIAARDPLFGGPAYPVSKSGVWMLTKSAARTLAPVGIRVNSVGPGFTSTNMTAAFETEEGAAYREMILANTPMNRFGRPEEVADLILFLASDEASFITGELIHPDGGWFTG